MGKTLVAAMTLAAAALLATGCGDESGIAFTSGPAPQPTRSHSTSPTKGPTMTAAQETALELAKSYLKLGGGFSHAGLIAQLHSPAGEGLPLDASAWAVNHAHADWNAQAVEAARGYLKMGGFTKAELIDQLTASDGDGFTPAQAKYAVHHADR